MQGVGQSAYIIARSSMHGWISLTQSHVSSSCSFHRNISQRCHLGVKFISYLLLVIVMNLQHDDYKPVGCCNDVKHLI